MLIIFGALKVEISGLFKLTRIKNINKDNNIIIYSGKIGDEDIMLVKTGMGEKNVRKALKFLSENYLSDISIKNKAGIRKTNSKLHKELDKISSLEDTDKSESVRVLAIGFCGSVSERFKIGDVVTYKSIKNLKSIGSGKFICKSRIDLLINNKELKADRDNIFYVDTCNKIFQKKVLKKKVELFKVNSATVPTLVTDYKQKKIIGEKFDVDVIDMESYWIGKFCYENKFPFLSIRSVSDSLNENMPDFFTNYGEHKIFYNIFNLIIGAVKNPINIIRIIKAIKNIKKAKLNLDIFLKEYNLSSLAGSCYLKIT